MIACLFHLLLAGQPAVAPPSDAAMKARVRFLSDDLLEGRGVGTPGGQIAATYLASELQAMGIAGAGADGSYFQPVSLVGVKLAPSTKLTVTAKGGSESFAFLDDFVAWTGQQQEKVRLDADLVFAGYGVESPDNRWNDWKGDPAQWKGKVVVMLVNDPPATEAEPALFAGRTLTYFGRWTYKFEEAARRGAAGVILLHTDESAGYPWSVVRTSNGSWKWDLAREAGAPPDLAMKAWMTDAAARRLMKLAGQDLDALRAKAASREFQPVPLGLHVALDLVSERRAVQAPNVVGLLKGRDPRLASEVVVYSAHWDHLGVGEADSTGDTIYNGAVDNASGCAGVLAIAQALAAAPPRRSALFLFPTAEEQGLLGAEFYAKHPLVPLAKTAADVNLDSMNLLGVTKDLSLLGVERSTLRDLADMTARDEHVTLSPDPQPEQGSFYRSDHFPFAKVGVPSISLKSGYDFTGHPKGWGQEQFKAFNEHHYHQPSDQYDPAADYSGMVEQIQFAIDFGRRIGDADALPRFLSTDEFSKIDRGR